MKAYRFIRVLLPLLVLAMTMPIEKAIGQPNGFDNLVNSVRGSANRNDIRIRKRSSGRARFIGAGAGKYFEHSASGTPADIGRNFLSANKSLFVTDTPRVDFTVKRTKVRDGRTNVHYTQTYMSLPIFGAEVMVQLSAAGNIECVLSDMLDDVSVLETDASVLTATINAASAQAAAVAWLVNAYPGITQATIQASEPALVIYSPDVVRGVGMIEAAWKIEVGNRGEAKELVLVSARSADIVFHFALRHSALDRYVQSGSTVREEGEGATSDTFVDYVYDALGETYDFYDSHHNRDSIDNNGMLLRAISIGSECNAYWDTIDTMQFGLGVFYDDIVAHELTHAVTQFESNLNYYSDSGAINESFSDMWGEWVDQGWDGGEEPDGSQYDWILGEGISCLNSGTGLRSMINPPDFSTWYGGDNPDRYNSPDYYRGTIDFAGVHHNSGVGNKLCYLLTAGASFNGYTITGMGVHTVADLMYRCNAALLTSTSDYPDLGLALQQAAIDLDFSTTERQNVEDACLAVEILEEDPVTCPAPPFPTVDGRLHCDCEYNELDCDEEDNYDPMLNRGIAQVGDYSVCYSRWYNGKGLFICNDWWEPVEAMDPSEPECDVINQFYWTDTGYSPYRYWRIRIHFNGVIDVAWRNQSCNPNSNPDCWTLVDPEENDWEHVTGYNTSKNDRTNPHTIWELLIPHDLFEAEPVIGVIDPKYIDPETCPEEIAPEDEDGDISFDMGSAPSIDTDDVPGFPSPPPCP